MHGIKDETEDIDLYISEKQFEKLKEKYNLRKSEKEYENLYEVNDNLEVRVMEIDKDNIYIGVEISKPVLAIATRKIQKFEKENDISLDNLYLMSFDAIKLSEVFKKGQVEKLYLNFSDPWPKKKHAKRRLTYSSFLEEYKKVLKKDGIIEFKTDNRILFEFSLVSMQNFGMTFLEVYLDLHKTDVPNIVTEYEEKFSPNGPIYKLVARM